MCELGKDGSKASVQTFLTRVLWETDTQGWFLDLFSKQVFLVEEENDGSVNEEFVVADGVEQHKRLVHAILQERNRTEG